MSAAPPLSRGASDYPLRLWGSNQRLLTSRSVRWRRLCQTRTGTESDTRPCHTTKTSSWARAVAGKALSLHSLTFRPFRTRFYKGILKFVAVSGKWFHVTPSRSSVLHMVLSLLLNDFLLRRLPTQTRNCGNMMRICCGIHKPAFQLSLQAPHSMIGLKFRFRFG